VVVFSVVVLLPLSADGATGVASVAGAGDTSVVVVVVVSFVESLHPIIVVLTRARAPIALTNTKFFDTFFMLSPSKKFNAIVFRFRSNNG
jgi:hypothetical protein